MVSICQHVDCVKAIEQMTPCMAIFGRWLLPKGEISSDEFSNLLLVFLGVAADIFEFMEVLAYRQIFVNSLLVHVVLVLWSWSLLQFAIHVPGSKKETKHTEQFLRHTFMQKVSHSRSGVGSSSAEAYKYVAQHVETGRRLAETVKGKQMALFEIILIFANVVFQDAPYFAFRIYTIFYQHITASAHMFFTMKNGLVIVLQLYRLVVLCGQIVKYKHHQKKFKKKLHGGSQYVSSPTSSLPYEEENNRVTNHSLRDQPKNVSEGSTRDEPHPWSGKERRVRLRAPTDLLEDIPGEYRGQSDDALDVKLHNFERRDYCYNQIRESSDQRQDGTMFTHYADVAEDLNTWNPFSARFAPSQEVPLAEEDCFFELVDDE